MVIIIFKFNFKYIVSIIHILSMINEIPLLSLGINYYYKNYRYT